MKKSLLLGLVVLGLSVLSFGQTSLFLSLDPADRWQTTSKTIKIRGSVPDTVQTVLIDNQPVDLSSSGHFNAKYTMPDPGKYVIKIVARSASGADEIVTRTILRLTSFDDVSPATMGFKAIQTGTSLGLISSKLNTQFEPQSKVTRAELYEILTMLHGPQPANSNASSTQAIARAEAVAAIVKANFSEVPDLVLDSPYLDVKAYDWSAPYISKVKKLGWLDYIISNKFNPKESISRAEFYILLSRTPLFIRDSQRLLSFDDKYMVQTTGQINKPQLLSFDLKNADIAIVLREFSAETGYNILTSKAITGKITARFTNVEPMDALQQILNANNYQYDIRGNTLRITGQAPSAKQETSIRTFTVNYANIDNLVAELVKLVPTLEGRVLVGKSSNSIIVDGDHPELKKITEIVNRLDAPPKQVMVEAKIFEINAGSDTSLGFGFFDNRTINDMQLLTETRGMASGPGADSSGFFVQVLRNDNNQQIYLNALASRSDANLISSPKIMALNNQSASLITGATLGYIVEKISPSNQGPVVAQEVMFLQTGVNFTFTPQITDDDNIKISLSPSIIDGEVVLGVPQTKTTMANTTVLVHDGQTFIIGGLIKTQLDNTETKVPILGDIPFIGNLFKKEALKEVKKELIIMVTPHIINAPMVHSMDKEIKSMTQKQKGLMENTSLFR